jgi:hypothetical protein
VSRKLDDLSPRFKPLAFEFLARLTEAQIPVLITSTLRTAAEQADAVRTGHSQVAHSKHQDGDAIDVVPYAQFLLKGDDKLQWDTGDPVWLKIGAIAEGLGLRWGGRFRPLNRMGIGWDPGHAEFIEHPASPLKVA